MNGWGLRSMIRRTGILIGIGVALAGRAAPVGFTPVEDEAARVVILANRNEPDSVELARFYADRREIPRDNIVALDLPMGEEIDWPTYVSQVLEPLRGWLIEHEWLQAIPMNLVDEAGRTRMSISGHRISYLVTCRGVPLKIRQSNELPPDAPEGTGERVKANHASVDSELAVLPVNESRRNSFVANPVFRKNAPDLWDRGAMLRVARLDGPTFPAARNLVESALTAERQGLIGRAVVDIGGPHKLGDTWFGEAAEELATAGWPLQVDREKAALAPTARADAVAWYFGWYQDSIAGPFRPDGYEFVPGAVALHLHSFSARSLRSFSNGGWVAPLVGRGVAATFGNVYEPYLEFTHQPQLIARALLGGATLGEAAYYAMPVLSWQSVVLGDPLYRPMRVAFAQQWERRDALPGRLASYVGLRRLEQLAQAAVPLEERLAVAGELMGSDPSPALALAQARLLDEAGDRAGACRALGVVGYLRRIRADEWGLVAEIGDTLSGWEAHAGALKVWANLLDQTLPEAQRLAWLRAGAQAAKAAGDYMQAAEWEKEIILLAPEPKT